MLAGTEHVQVVGPAGKHMVTTNGLACAGSSSTRLESCMSGWEGSPVRHNPTVGHGQTHHLQVRAGQGDTRWWAAGDMSSQQAVGSFKERPHCRSSCLAALRIHTGCQPRVLAALRTQNCSRSRQGLGPCTEACATDKVGAGAAFGDGGDFCAEC